MPCLVQQCRSRAIRFWSRGQCMAFVQTSHFGGVESGSRAFYNTRLLVSQAWCKDDGHRSLQQGMRRAQTLVQPRSEDTKSRLRLSFWEPAVTRSLCDEASGAHGCSWCPTRTGRDIPESPVMAFGGSLVTDV